MSDHAFFVYWGRVNDDVFETCMNTLLKRSPSTHLQVHSDDRPNDLSRDYGINWVNVDNKDVKGRRALCKIERLQKLVHQLRQGDRLLVADVDLYFLDDPFKAFEQDFDFAVTTRCHPYRWPVNGGVFFLTINEKTRRFVDYYLTQCQEPTSPHFLEFRKERNGGKVEPKYNPDWEIGQDFLCAAWLNKDDVMVPDKTIDLGSDYNYCPNTDVFGLDRAREMIEMAYKASSYKVLHLKSELKLCIYDGYMEDAITKRCNGSWNWYASNTAIQPE